MERNRKCSAPRESAFTPDSRIVSPAPRSRPTCRPDLLNHERRESAAHPGQFDQVAVARAEIGDVVDPVANQESKCVAAVLAIQDVIAATAAQSVLAACAVKGVDSVTPSRMSFPSPPYRISPPSPPRRVSWPPIPFEGVAAVVTQQGIAALAAGK